MLRLPVIAALALSAAASTVACAQDRARAAALEPIEDIEWSYQAADQRDDDESRPLLRLARDGMNSSFDADELPELMARLAGSLGDRGQGVAFSLVREAGALACAGEVTGPGSAGGTCRFDPDEGFAAALAARGLHTENGEELLVLALVDARLASVDALSREGFALEEVDELVAVSALDVSPAFVAELRAAGLVTRDIDELIAARGVELDAAWVRAMAEAGFPHLDIDTAIQMRALDVTPEYARRMVRVMRATEGVE